MSAGETETVSGTLFRAQTVYSFSEMQELAIPWPVEAQPTPFPGPSAQPPAPDRILTPDT